MNNNGREDSLTHAQMEALAMVKDLSPSMAQAVREEFTARLSTYSAEREDPWKAYTLADAYQERPPLEHVVGKLLELPSLNIAYGAPGTLKSFLLQDLAVCVASGLEWLTPAPWKGTEGHGIATRQCPVMWLDFDNGTRRTHNRFEALARARKLDPSTPITYYSMPHPWLSATQAESVGALVRRIQKAGARLVIIDNLGNVSGDADENSADMGTVMSQFRQVTEETGAAVVLIHHQRKGNGMAGRAGDTLRGHSSIEASLDLALLIEREPYSESISIKATKVRGTVIYPFGAQFTFTPKNDDDLLDARFFGLEGDDNESDAAIKKAILDILVEGPMNKTQIKQKAKALEVKGGLNRIGNLVDQLVYQGKVKQNPGKTTNEKVFSV